MNLQQNFTAIKFSIFIFCIAFLREGDENKERTHANGRKRRLQRSISRKYEQNKKEKSYCKISNIVKSEKELIKLNHRLTSIRQDYLHDTTSKIIKREPSFICMEDLNVKGMMKNREEKMKWTKSTKV